jgi:hypothetical protein
MKDKVLSPADLKKINAALHSASEFLLEIERARAAGIEVTEYEQRAQHQKERLLKIKAAYFQDSR